MTTTLNLKDTQIALEEEALGLGIKRYREALEAGQGDLPPGMKLIKTALGPLTAKLEEEMKVTFEGRAGRSASLYLYLTQFDCDLIAFVTVKTVINGIGKNDPLCILHR